METKDLRIGNWIKYEDKLVQVVQLSSLMILCQRDENQFLVNCAPEVFQPIELTEEVLVKIGFKNVFQSKVTKAKIVLNEEISDNEFNEVTVVFFNSGCSYLHINIRRDKSGRDDTLIIRDIKYLHQLQNAYYCLTNQELEIKL